MPGENSSIPSSLRDRLDIDFALTSAGLGVWELDPSSMKLIWDDRCQELFGLSRDHHFPYEEAIAYIHPEDVSRVDEAVQKAFQQEYGGLYDITYRTIGADDGILRWVRFYGKSYFDENGQVYRFGGVAQDVTQDMKNLEREHQAQSQILNAFESSPVGIAQLDRQGLTFLSANEFYGELVGRKPHQIIGKSLMQALPELEGQGFVELLQGVLETGIPYIAKEVAVTLRRNQELETIYVDLTYHPQRQAGQQNISGILVIATDVTEQVRSRKVVEAREAQLRDIIATAPAAMGLFVGRDLVVEMPNQAFIDIVGKGPDIVGKPLREVMPELENQPFLQILDEVYTSGVMFQSDGSQVNIVRHGVMTYNFYNITYTPLLNEKGEVYAILDIAIDVTEAIRIQQRLAKAQAELAEAIELAELATWEVNFNTRKVEYSDRLRQWCEFDPQEELTIERGYEPILADDHPLIHQAIREARLPGSNGFFDVIYTITGLKTGQKRSIHAQGKINRDRQGVAISVSGSAQDITLQMENKASLELLVQKRTEELAAINVELATSNEDLARINQQLYLTNEHLSRSNESLEQFAYIASHDLQEPLRKVQQFSDLLVRRHQQTLGEDARFLERIQGSAQRMSVLIQDLLTFSRISNGPVLTQSTSLSQVLNQVMDNLSVSIEETNARIESEELPVIRADERQLEQLFQNLLSNALKFSSKDLQGNPMIPHIDIKYQLFSSDQIAVTDKWQPGRGEYHRIIIKDNGIGFDETYADRIFGVFQRLHGKNEFAGTGVGLAICQKVVSNHGGFIQAQGDPGKGASFCVYLPA